MKTFIVALALSISGVVNAQMPYILTTADHGIAQLAGRVAHRDGRTYVGYITEKQSSNGDIMFTSKATGDASFAVPVSVTATGKINATLQRGPEFAIAPNGTIHMVWMEQRINNSPDIFYSRGSKNGTEWSAPIDISLDQQRASQDFPSIAVDSAGNVFVAWIDNRDRVDGTLDNDQLYFNRSLDGGTTWMTPKRASIPPDNIGGSCECCRTSIEASPNGNLYMAYRTNVNNLRDIFVVRSMDRGETFLEPVRIQTKPWMVMACPATGPMTSLDKNENLHVVYRNAGTGRAALFYCQLPHAWDRAIPEIPLTDLEGSGANYPDIVSDGDGALTMVYQSSDGNSERKSTDGGNTWSNAAVLDVAGTMQMYPAVAYDYENSRLLNVWQDNRRDKSDIIYYERPSLPSTTLPKLVMLQRTLGQDSIHLSWSSTDHAATWYEVSHNTTSVVTLDTAITLGLSAGPVITVTPITSIGRGEARSISTASVRANDVMSAVRLSRQPARSGDVVTLSVESPTPSTWTIYDAQGKTCGTVISSPSAEGQSLIIPELSSGAYLLHCESPSISVRLLVNTR